MQMALGAGAGKRRRDIGHYSSCLLPTLSLLNITDVLILLPDIYICNTLGTTFPILCMVAQTLLYFSKISGYAWPLL